MLLARHLARRGAPARAVSAVVRLPVRWASPSAAPPTAPAADTAVEEANESTWQTFKRVLSAARAAKAAKAAEGGDGKDKPGALDRVSLARLVKFIKPEVVPLSVSVATLTITTG
jgi:hypothetical protein